MKLYLVRHGIAIDRASPDCPSEPDRCLTPKGIKKTRRAARGLATVAIKPDLLLSSPYRRAKQTAEIFASALGCSPSKIRFTDSLLPNADPGAIYRELASHEAEEVVVFGHAPHLDQALALAIHADDAVTVLKKASVARLTLFHLAPPEAMLDWILTPALLRRLR
jgi:phosphohistidine phosphatase